ncbi:MAG: glycosyltransferase family 4 protein [Methanobacteriaceae archaeon]|nr:glycosyltransferase family 4 protein [Methanobacteriaceae archaeon]
MRIAMIISTPFPPEEGIGHYTYNLSKNLIDRGHEITVLTRGDLSRTKNFVYKNIDVFKPTFLPLYPFHVQLHGYFLNKFFKSISNDFDLVHIHSPLAPIINSNIPVIGTIHTSLIEDIKHFQVNNLRTMAIKLTTFTSGRFLTQKLINKSNILTTVSSSVAEELFNYYNNVNPLVIGNGVDENVFFPINNKSDDYLLYVGRLDYRKGIFDLIEASKLLDDNLKIYIAGSGDLSVKLSKLIKNKNKNINLLGHVEGDSLIKLYQNAKMLIFPSHYEGLPTVLLESMACGLPVITSNIPAHKDLIKDNQNGLLTEKGNPKDIAKKINILINDNDLREKLGKNARQTIEKKFTWNIIGKKYEEIYKEIVS